MQLLRPSTLIAIAVLAATAAGGWLATGALQRTVAIAPGLQSCWRLDGGSKQVDCASEEFLAGARESAGGRSGDAREAAILGYVRRAEQLASDDQRLANVCHPAMHQLGRTEGATAGKAGRVPEFPVASTQLCTAGYVHGLSEGYLAGTPDADVARVFPTLCHDPAAREGCAHGVGHALLRAQSGTSDVVEAVGAATRRCAGLPGDSAGDCYDGAYMELAMRTKPEPVATRDYVRTCSGEQDPERMLSCWGYLTLSFTSNDTPASEVPKWCAKADLPGQYTCVEGYGRDLGVKGVTGCSKVIGNTTLQGRCIDGAIGLQIGSGHVAPATARRACTKLTDRALETYCTRAVGRYAKGRVATEAA